MASPPYYDRRGHLHIVADGREYTLWKRSLSDIKACCVLWDGRRTQSLNSTIPAADVQSLAETLCQPGYRPKYSFQRGIWGGLLTYDMLLDGSCILMCVSEWQLVRILQCLLHDVPYALPSWGTIPVDHLGELLDASRGIVGIPSCDKI